MTRYPGETYEGSDDEANDMVRAAQKSAPTASRESDSKNRKTEKGMTYNAALTDLIGRDLTGFKVVRMAEAFDVNDDGRKTKSIGYFKDSDVAKAFIGPRATNSHKDVKDVFVLTDGKVGLVIDHREIVNIVEDEVALLEIKKRAIAKLTPEERKVLGLG